MNNVIYIAYVDFADSFQNRRNAVIAASSKVKYVCSSLNKCGFSVHLVSASGLRAGKWVPGSKYNILPKTTLKLFPSFYSKNRLLKFLSSLFTQSCFFLYLLKNTKRGQTVIVYHSLGYMRIVKMLKAIKNIKLILEVEEIYGDVIPSQKNKKKELRFFQIADAYIFPTQSLNSIVNDEQKPYAILHGIYSSHVGYNIKKPDDVIHVVYGGSLDSRKGSIEAAKSAMFLPPKYHIHIMGFGTKQEENIIKNVVEASNKPNCARVTYDGGVSEVEYSNRIKNYHIGLCPQSISAEFNQTSFPSKILFFLSHGLSVVCSRIKTFEESAVGDVLHFYNEQTPEKIAEAIMKVDLENSCDGRTLLRQLDTDFQNQMQSLLQ